MAESGRDERRRPCGPVGRSASAVVSTVSFAVFLSDASYQCRQFAVFLTYAARHIVGLPCSENGLIFSRRPFWCGASIAFVPALFALPAVWYAGVALVNSVWQLFFARDCPEPLVIRLALVYGIPFGPLLQCILLGAIADYVWRRRAGRLKSWLEIKTRWTKVGLWAAAEFIYTVSGVWIYLAIFAYGLAAAMSVLIHP